MAIQLVKTKAGNSRCLISFSAFNPLSTLAQLSYFPFTFYKVLTAQSECDVLFVGDESNSWYHGKIKGIEGSGIDNLKMKVRDLVADYDHIIVLGASMGGHAALHFHDCSWVNQIIALQPQLFIRNGWPRFQSCNLGCDVPAPNYKYSSSGPPITLIVGQLELFDIYQAALFLGEGFACSVTIVPNAYHNVCYHWLRLGVLNRAVNLFVSGAYKPGISPYGKPYGISQTPELEEHVEALPEINQYFEVLHGGLGGELEAFFAAASLVDRFPNWESISVAFGLIAARNGFFALSHEYLACKSISIEDRHGPLSLYYYVSGDFSRFEQCLLEAFKFNAVSPTDSFVSRFLPVLNAPDSESYDLRKSLTLLGLADHFPLIISAATRSKVLASPTNASPDDNASRAVSEGEMICLGLENSRDRLLQDGIDIHSSQFNSKDYIHCSLSMLHGHYLKLAKLLLCYYSQKVSGPRCLDGQHEPLMRLWEQSLRNDAVNREMNEPSLSRGSDGHPSLESFAAIIECAKSVSAGRQSGRSVTRAVGTYAPTVTDGLSQQLSAQSGLVEPKTALDPQAERVKALEAEKKNAAKAAEELKQQLAAQSAQAAEAKQARDQQAERVKALEAELAQQTGNLAAMAEALQRLRQLAMRPTS